MPEFDAVFAFELRNLVWVVIILGTLLLSLIATIHCAVQKPEAFNAVGTLSKGTWLGILAVSFVLAGLLGLNGAHIFALIALAAALVYLLDVRTGIKDIGGSIY
jgi:hypothetical protein